MKIRKIEPKEGLLKYTQLESYQEGGSYLGFSKHFLSKVISDPFLLSSVSKQRLGMCRRKTSGESSISAEQVNYLRSLFFFFRTLWTYNSKNVTPSQLYGNLMKFNCFIVYKK